MTRHTAQKRLEDQHVGVGTPVLVNVPEDMRAAKFNGRKGVIVEMKCEKHPIPIIELDRSGKRLAIELKHLIYPKQSNLFG